MWWSLVKHLPVFVRTTSCEAVPHSLSYTKILSTLTCRSLSYLELPGKGSWADSPNVSCHNLTKVKSSAANSWYLGYQISRPWGHDFSHRSAFLLRISSRIPNLPPISNVEAGAFAVDQAQQKEDQQSRERHHLCHTCHGEPFKRDNFHLQNGSKWHKSLVFGMVRPQ